MNAGWRPHPDARRLTPLHRVEPGRVIGIGAICDLVPAPDEVWSQSFSVQEFVMLEDGQRVTLNDGRGFTVGEDQPVNRRPTSPDT